jgi:integrase/recombinase XerD
MARPGRPAMPKPDLSPLVETFLDMLSTERGAAMNTRQAYWRDLADVSLFLRATNGVEIKNASADDIKSYLTDLADKTNTKGTAKGKIAVRTVARRLSALRQFYRFLVSEGVRADDPTSAIESPKQGRTLPKTLSESEVTALITTASEKGSAEAIRLVCLLEMLYATGLRVSELVGLPLSAIGENSQYLIVSGKAGRERMIPLTTPAQAALEGYLKSRSEHMGGEFANRQEKWLFPSKTSDSGHLTRQRFAQLLKDLAREAKIDEYRVSPHILRHAFATHLLSNGADLRSVQKMLGHADIATTQIYTHILGENVKNTVKEKHPLSKSSGTGKK